VRGINLKLARSSTVALSVPMAPQRTTTIDMLIGLTQPTPARSHFCRGAPRRDAVKAAMIGAMTQTGQSTWQYLSVPPNWSR